MDLQSTAGKVVESKAAVTWGVHKPQSIEIVRVEVPKKGEVRVKMAAAGICFSDIVYTICDVGFVRYPVVLGHEGCGVVESVGEGVTDFKTGDVVIPLWKPECGKCDLCRDPRTNLCDKIDVFLNGWQSDGTARMFLNGKPVSQLSGVGCFSEYCVMSTSCIVKVNSKAPLIKLPPFGCCFPTGYGAAVRGDGVKPGMTTAVFGLGSVGLCAVMGCRDAGATRIIGVDINPDKFEIGKKFGCTEFVNPKDHKEPVQEVIKKMTGDKLDFAIVAVGNEKVTESAVASTRRGFGKTVMIGILHGEPFTVPVHNWDLLFGKTVTGTWAGGCNCLTDIPKFVDSYMNGKFQEVDMLTSGVIPLEKINEGFTMLQQGKVLRNIIKF